MSDLEWADSDEIVAALRQQVQSLATMLGRTTTALHIQKMHEGIDIKVCETGICPVVTRALAEVGR